MVLAFQVEGFQPFYVGGDGSPGLTGIMSILAEQEFGKPRLCVSTLFDKTKTA